MPPPLAPPGRETVLTDGPPPPPPPPGPVLPVEMLLAPCPPHPTTTNAKIAPNRDHFLKTESPQIYRPILR